MLHLISEISSDVCFWQASPLPRIPELIHERNMRSSRTEGLWKRNLEAHYNQCSRLPRFPALFRSKTAVRALS